MINRERGKGMDPQVSLRRPAPRSNLGFRCLYGVENLPRSIEKDLAFSSQCESPGGAIEKATPRRDSSRVTSFETAEGDKPRSSAAAAKLPRSTTRVKMFISFDELGIRELNS
jgi:hypothetical protein